MSRLWCSSGEVSGWKEFTSELFKELSWDWSHFTFPLKTDIRTVMRFADKIFGKHRQYGGGFESNPERTGCRLAVTIMKWNAIVEHVRWDQKKYILMNSLISNCWWGTEGSVVVVDYHMTISYQYDAGMKKDNNKNESGEAVQVELEKYYLCCRRLWWDLTWNLCREKTIRGIENLLDETIRRDCLV